MSVTNVRIRTNRKRGIRISKNGLFFLLLLTIAFLKQSNLFPMYYMTAILIALAIFCYALLKYISLTNKKSVEYIVDVGKLLLSQWILFFVYNVFIYASGNGENQFLKSSFVQILFPPIILLGALGFFFIFKHNALRYFVYAIIVQYVIIQVYQLIVMGPGDYVSGILTVFQGNSVGNPFETNSDLVLSLGLLLIFYSDRFVKLNDKQNRHALLMLILIVLGGKKISFAAILMICIFFVLSNRITYKRRVKIETIASIIVILACFAFVYLIDSGIISAYTYTHGINTMGRVKMYDYVAQYMQLSPTFLGKGFSFANLLLERERVLTFNGTVYGLHSDVLKMFVEMGTIMFTFWLVYNLIFLPKRINAKYGPRVGNLFWFTTIYLFSTYLTDNTINYYITQTLYALILLHGIYISRENNMAANA